MAVTFPWTVIVVCPVGSTAHGTPANMPIVLVGWQPMPRVEPEAAVTLCPTVIVDGALCASSTAPGATLMLPRTLITASGAMLHAPVTVMLAYVPEWIVVNFPEAKLPPVHVNVRPQFGPAARADPVGSARASATARAPRILSRRSFSTRTTIVPFWARPRPDRTGSVSPLAQRDGRGDRFGTPRWWDPPPRSPATLPSGECDSRWPFASSGPSPACGACWHRKAWA